MSIQSCGLDLLAKCGICGREAKEAKEAKEKYWKVSRLADQAYVL